MEQNSAHRPLTSLDTSRSGTGHGSQFLPQAQAVAVDERSEASGEPAKNAEELVAAALRRADQAMQAWMAQTACAFFAGKNNRILFYSCYLCMKYHTEFLCWGRSVQKLAGVW